MRLCGPPAFHGIDRGARSAQGFSRRARGVGVALSVAVPVVRTAMQPQVPRLRTAAERERHDVVDLQPIARAAAPPAVRVDIAATTLVAPPHLPPHSYRDIPGPRARQRAEATQRGKVPLQRRRTLRRPRRAVPGAVRKPLRRQSREPAAAPHWCPRRVAFAAFELRSGRASCTAQDTAHPRLPAIAVGSPLPLRQRSSPTAVATHRPRSPACVLRLAMASRRRSAGATKALCFAGTHALILRDSLRRRNGAADNIPHRCSACSWRASCRVCASRR